MDMMFNVSNEQSKYLARVDLTVNFYIHVHVLINEQKEQQLQACFAA